jgi:Protein of unknown function (Gmx_para_CXXCG)
MRFYSIESRSVCEGQLMISGEHKWILPGLNCPSCGAWGWSGKEFPSVQPSGEAAKHFRGGPKPLGWFRDVLPRLGLRLSDGSDPGPTFEFGPLVGKVESGRILTDFIWPRSWTILVRERTKGILSDCGIHIPSYVKALIKRNAKLEEEIYELQLEAGLMVHESCLERSEPKCELCGRDPVSLRATPLNLKRSDGPVRSDLFRAANFPTLIFATERFASVCEEYLLSNVVFKLVQLV